MALVIDLDGMDRPEASEDERQGHLWLSWGSSLAHGQTMANQWSGESSTYKWGKKGGGSTKEKQKFWLQKPCNQNFKECQCFGKKNKKKNKNKNNLQTA